LSPVPLNEGSFASCSPKTPTPKPQTPKPLSKAKKVVELKKTGFKKLTSFNFLA